MAVSHQMMFFSIRLIFCVERASLNTHTHPSFHSTEVSICEPVRTKNINRNHRTIVSPTRVDWHLIYSTYCDTHIIRMITDFVNALARARGHRPAIEQKFSHQSSLFLGKVFGEQYATWRKHINHSCSRECTVVAMHVWTGSCPWTKNHCTLY